MLRYLLQYKYIEGATDNYEFIIISNLTVYNEKTINLIRRVQSV